MTNKQTDRKIYVTDNYSLFKTLEGNRSVKDPRIEKIVQSINTVGYITSPILVNEKMEVIDGQGRLAALERLHLPVEYIIHEGIGINECRHMNIHQSNWTERDYIKSYACLGDDNYARLQSLTDKFDLPIAVILASCRNDTEVSNSAYSVRNGNFKVKKEDIDRIKFELYYASNFKQVAKNIGGTKAPFYIATLYAYRNLNTEQANRLEEVIRYRMLEFPALTKVSGYLKYFDEFYNAKQRKEKRIHLYLQHEMDNKL